jgi:hypothetical protein
MLIDAELLVMRARERGWKREEVLVAFALSVRPIPTDQRCKRDVVEKRSIDCRRGPRGGV